MRALLMALLVTSACGKSYPRYRGHDVVAQLVQKSLDDADKDLAHHDATRISLDCMMAEPGTGQLPEELADRATDLCGVEAPKLVLRDALDKMNRRQDRNATLGTSLDCISLWVPDAFKLIAKHPHDDVELDKLVAEYTRKCPNEVASAQRSAKVLASRPPRKPGADDGEQSLENELATIESAIAAHDTNSVGTDCMFAYAGSVPEALASRVTKLCGIDGPKLLLQSALAEVERRHAKSPDLDEINCVQVNALEALSIIKSHPSGDAELARLVAEYTRRCPQPKPPRAT